jgi:beta-xylosidase
MTFWSIPPSLAGLVVAATVMGAAPAAAATGPSYPGDFPDPFVLAVDGTYYAYATQTGTISVQGVQSPDGSTWRDVRDALPLLPLWAEWGHTWAPAVLRRGLVYNLYYTVRDRASGRQCISVAPSLLPQGPYLDLSLSPWLCQLERGGSIDPYAFVDGDGAAYLMWKSDDNALGRPTALWGQRLSSDGLSLVGSPVQLLGQDQAWEAPAIEGPAMVRAAGAYYLFYGANQWDSRDAAIGFARCDGPLGPCTKATIAGPWMASHGQAVGPSGPTFFTDTAGALSMAYHAWSPGRVGYGAGGARSLWVDRIDFVGGQPVVAGP